MGSAVLHAFVVLLGLVLGVWAAVDFQRRNPALPRQRRLKRVAVAAVVAIAVFLGLSWIDGEFNGIYLAGGLAFAAGMIAVDLFRMRHHTAASRPGG
jgi:hypothetical protein